METPSSPEQTDTMRTDKACEPLARIPEQDLQESLTDVPRQVLQDLLSGRLAARYQEEDLDSEYAKFLDNFDSQLNWIGEPLVPPLESRLSNSSEDGE